jgi:intracellular sulfur oxidation DsrE/DsrF family protein
MLRKTLALTGALFLAMVATPTLANPTICYDGPDPDDGIDLNAEFGEGTTDITRCLSNQGKPKVVVQINKFCRDAVPNADCDVKRAYALGNIQNMINDYEGSHGIDNWEIVAVVHSGGWGMVVQNDFSFTNIAGEGGGDGGVAKVLSNQFQDKVEGLIAQGVRFLFCQNTTRGMIGKGNLPTINESAGGATEALIDGVEYTTAGVTAIADFQKKGYSYVQP